MTPRRNLVFTVAFIILLTEAPLRIAAFGDFLRKATPQHGGPADWTKEAQRNLSRFESRLLRHTVGKLRSSHVEGVVPFELFDPVVTCPPPSRLMRLDPGGPVARPTRWEDGAKWMCVPFPQTARPGCVVLSFGSNDQFEFERSALNMTPCTIHTFDCTSGMLGNATQFATIDPARHRFHTYCVGSREMAAANPSKVLNWEGLMRAVRPQGQVPGRDGEGSSAGSAFGGSGAASSSIGRRSRRRRGGSGASGVPAEVFVLKVDVEGFEWQLLSEWGPRTPGLPAFLAIEIHNWVEEDVAGASPPPPSTPPPPPPPPPAQGWNPFRWLFRSRRGGAPDEAASAAAAAEAAAKAAKRAALQAVWARRQRVYAGELSLMFLHLARLGYAVVAREDNPNGDINARLCCAEFLFIRVRGPEEGRPGVWDWTGWLNGLVGGRG